MVCVRFPLSSGSVTEQKVTAQTAQNTSVRVKLARHSKCQIWLNISRFPYRICLDCNGTMGKPSYKSAKNSGSKRRRKKEQRASHSVWR